MKSDQGTTIVMIVFILLSVLLMVLCWTFYSGQKDNFQKFEEANRKVTELEGSLRTVNSDVDTLKGIIGAAPTASIADIEARNIAYATQTAGTADTTKGYTELLDDRIAKLNGVTKELGDANVAKLALENRFAALSENMRNQIKIHEDAKLAAEKKLQEEQGIYTQSMALRSQMQKQLEEENQATHRMAAEAIDQAKQEAARTKNNLEAVSTINERLAEELAGIRSPMLVQEDGAVVSVNQLSGVVNLNIGSASGLRNGITFAVFDPSEKNLAEARSKGSIEVSQILGPNRAEARILQTVITDPIQKGDLIYTPVWKPGLHPRFVLSGRMLVPGFGSRGEDNTTLEDDLKDVINLILANGGIVDYYMTSDGNIVKINSRIDVQGKLHILSEEPANFQGGDKILQETAFLVKGTGEANALMSANMLVLDEQAKIQGIPSITLPELLRRMGWRNAVPSQGYGNRANESDIAPRPIRPMPVSSGIVSPLYMQQAEVAKRTSPGNVSPLYLEGPAMKTSPGTVSPLFQKDRKPVSASTGTVSGIFGGQ